MQWNKMRVLAFRGMTFGLLVVVLIVLPGGIASLLGRVRRLA